MCKEQSYKADVSQGVIKQTKKKKPDYMYMSILPYCCSYAHVLLKKTTLSLENDCVSPTPPVFSLMLPVFIDFIRKSSTLFSRDEIRPQLYTPKSSDNQKQKKMPELWR